MSELTRWVGEVNVTLPKDVPWVRRLLFSTPHDPKVFERRAGFRVYRTLMEKRV